jgi:hypothetical protein
MNLIQIQNDLKQLPQDPQTMKLLANYANGSSTQVPPFLALSEIQRRNAAEEKANISEAPEGTVNEQEQAKAMKQSADLMTAQQAQQQQGAQQLQSALSQGQGQVAPGTPQPQGQEIPQQPTMQAAEGGIMRLPVRDEMFNFADGGIVAFAKGDVVDYKTKAAEYLDKQPNLPKTYMDLMEEAKLKNPELAKPAGQEAQRQIQELQTQDTANAGKFNEREEARKRQDFWDSLIAGGEATRGQSGIGALMGGFGKSSSAARAAADERRARQEAAQREQQMNVIKMNAEIENLRRAEQRGDVAEQQKSLAKISEIQNAMDSAKANLGVNLGQLATQEGTLAESIRAHKANEILQGQQIGATSKLYAPEVQKNYEFLKRLYPNLTNDQLIEKSVGMTKQAISNEGRLDAVMAAKVAEIRKDYEKKILNAQQMKDPTLVNALIQQQNDAIARATAGVGGLTQPGQPAQGNTRIRVDANGNPI